MCEMEDIDFLKDIFKSKNLRFNEIPKDIQKLIISKLLLNPKIIIDLHIESKFDDLDINELVCNNRILWESLWYKYISTVVNVNDISTKDLKIMFMSAFILYDYDPEYVFYRNEEVIRSEYKRYGDEWDFGLGVGQKIDIDYVYDNLKNNNFNVIQSKGAYRRKNSKATYKVVEWLEDYKFKKSKSQSVNYDILNKYLPNIVYLDQHSNRDYQGILSEIAKSGNTKLLQMFLDRGFNITKKELNHMLAHASENNNIKMIKFLLKKGADVNDGNYNLVVDSKTKTYHGQLLKILLKYGLDVNKINYIPDYPTEGQTLLFHASYIPDIEELIKNGADVNFNGDTPLHMAVSQNKYFEIVGRIKTLIKHGANPNIKNKQGKTPLDRYIELAIVRSTTYKTKKPNKKIVKILQKAMLKNSISK